MVESSIGKVVFFLCRVICPPGCDGADVIDWFDEDR